MANNAENISAGKAKIGGAIWAAPAGTTGPTDSTTELAEAFKCLGYVSEDGLTNDNSTDMDLIHAWGGDVVCVIPGEQTDQYKFTLIEVLSADVLKFVHGDAKVTTAQGGSVSVTVNGEAAPEHTLVIEMLMRGRAVRHVIPRAVITERGEISYVDNDIAGFELTVTALPDSKGNTHYEYIAAAS